MKQHIIAALFFTLVLPLSGQAIANNHQQTGSSTTTAESMSDGEVRKIDMDAKKITLRHGPIANLGMPSMTMVFQVKDPAMLEQVKPGDKVRFSAEKSGGAYVVTKLQKNN
jgi:Cu(I)/Ag(I) efflux system protein CusF